MLSNQHHSHTNISGSSNESIQLKRKELEKVTIEEKVDASDDVQSAFLEMKHYRNWSPSTFNSYMLDVQHYEDFLYEKEEEITLENAKMHLIQLWINQQNKDFTPVSTIRRRIAALSSIYSFYKELGIIQRNPFKAVQLPVGAVGHHSPVLTIDQLKQVYQYLYVLKEEGVNVEVTVKVMMFYGAPE